MKEWASACLIVARVDLGEGRLAHVPAADGPLVVLFQEEGTDEAQQTALGKIPTTLVRRAISSFRRSSGLVEPSLRQRSRGKSMWARISSSAASRHAAALPNWGSSRSVSALSSARAAAPVSYTHLRAPETV